MKASRKALRPATLSARPQLRRSKEAKPYHPEVAGRAVLYAADHPKRKQYYVGASTVATIWANRIAAALLDRYYLARTGYESQQAEEPKKPHRPHHLRRPLDDAGGHDFGAHGSFDARSHGRAPQLWLSQHPALSTTAALAAGAGGAAAALYAARRHSSAHTREYAGRWAPA
ncbi:hypothetical protein [Streptomyces sp. NBC_01443]|uniref:hypothetical protein n=1 Tax=Streptomyces sp. NBC_01443 TaxID=2903868 RepID=UPI00224E5856|nr:hypothetical protein [Streptomyces sp. NBC_01443]MCX4632286.1 hypothetical protein [Streptomyces sp. NBC_01443]